MSDDYSTSGENWSSREHDIPIKVVYFGKDELADNLEFYRIYNRFVEATNFELEIEFQRDDGDEEQETITEYYQMTDQEISMRIIEEDLHIMFTINVSRYYDNLEEFTSEEMDELNLNIGGVDYGNSGS